MVNIDCVKHSNNSVAVNGELTIKLNLNDKFSWSCSCGKVSAVAYHTKKSCWLNAKKHSRVCEGGEF